MPVVLMPSISSFWAETKKMKIGTSERMDMANICPKAEADVAS